MLVLAEIPEEIAAPEGIIAKVEMNGFKLHIYHRPDSALPYFAVLARKKGKVSIRIFDKRKKIRGFSDQKYYRAFKKFLPCAYVLAHTDGKLELHLMDLDKYQEGEKLIIKLEGRKNQPISTKEVGDA